MVEHVFDEINENRSEIENFWIFY